MNQNSNFQTFYKKIKEEKSENILNVLMRQQTDENKTINSK